MIATKFAEISQEYDKISKEDIEIPAFSESEYPIITDSDVRKVWFYFGSSPHFSKNSLQNCPRDIGYGGKFLS